MADDELITEVARLARSEREITSALIAHLAEFDQRRLYRGAGCPSLFAYCTEVLCLSEHEAYNRIEAARVVRRFPRVLDMLADGKLNLTTVRLLSPNLTAENSAELLAEASAKGKREVERLLVRHFPKPAVPESIRKVPVRSERATGSSGVIDAAASAALAGSGALSDGGPPTDLASPIQPDDQHALGVGRRDDSIPRPSADSNPEPGARVVFTPSPRREILRPLSSDQYEVRFTASAGTCEKLRLAKDLLRHSVPDGNTAEVIDRALTALLEDLARKKYAATVRPRARAAEARVTVARAGSRHIPAQVKRTVWMRDVGRCAFVAKGGRRCSERGFLEFHHLRPYAVGGAATAENLQLRCRAHNAYEAELYYGAGVSEGAEDAAFQLVPERVRPATGSISMGAARASTATATTSAATAATSTAAGSTSTATKDGARSPHEAMRSPV